MSLDLQEINRKTQEPTDREAREAAGKCAIAWAIPFFLAGFAVADLEFSRNLFWSNDVYDWSFTILANLVGGIASALAAYFCAWLLPYEVDPLYRCWIWRRRRGYQPLDLANKACMDRVMHYIRNDLAAKYDKALARVDRDLRVTAEQAATVKAILGRAAAKDDLLARGRQERAEATLHVLEQCTERLTAQRAATESEKRRAQEEFLALQAEANDGADLRAIATAQSIAIDMQEECDLLEGQIVRLAFSKEEALCAIQEAAASVKREAAAAYEAGFDPATRQLLLKH